MIMTRRLTRIRQPVIKNILAILVLFASLLSLVVSREDNAESSYSSKSTTTSTTKTTTLHQEGGGWTTSSSSTGGSIPRTRDVHGMYIATSLDELRDITRWTYWQQHQLHGENKNQQRTAGSAAGRGGSATTTTTTTPFLSMTLTWVEDRAAECSTIQQNATTIESIYSAVDELMMTTTTGQRDHPHHDHSYYPPIPTIRWTVASDANRFFDIQFLLSSVETSMTSTPGLLITTRTNDTESFTVEYSGSYHQIVPTIHHYYDWLTIWSTSRHDPNMPAITLSETKPKTFATTQDVFDYWDIHSHHIVVDDTTTKTTDPLLLVYYHQSLSLCPSKQEAASAVKKSADRSLSNASVVQEETNVFDLFAITVAGRRDRFFFYSYDCQAQLRVYDGGAAMLDDKKLLYTWERSVASPTSSSSSSSIRNFLVQATSDGLIMFHRELTYPIAMAHDIQIVALSSNDSGGGCDNTSILDETKCREWKRRDIRVICLQVQPNEYRLIAALDGLPPNRVVIVDEGRRVHVQPVNIELDEFVETTLFTRRPPAPGSTTMYRNDDGEEEPIAIVDHQDHNNSGGIKWIEDDNDQVFPRRGIVVAVSRTCGHCQRLLAILTRLDGLLQELHWTDDFPLYVIDVTNTDLVQPLWLPALYYNTVESPTRTFRDETEILEWVFSQMPDDKVVALQHRL